MGENRINSLFNVHKKYKKVNIINSYRFGGQVDYQNATVIYSLRSFFGWSDAILKIRRSSDNAVKWVFFDGNTITLSSLVGDSRTLPSATTLSTWIGSNDGYVEEWIGQIFTGLDTSKIINQSTTSNQPKFISSGNIINKNTKPAVDFLNSIGYLKSSPITALNIGNNFTILTVSNNNQPNSIGVILNTNDLGVNRLNLINDRRLVKKGLRIITSGTNGEVDMLSPQDISNQKLISGIVNGSINTGDVYFNGIIQNNGVSWSGTYINSSFRLGTDNVNISPLNGTIQECIIFPSDKTGDLTELHTDINNYYSIY